MPFAVDDAAMIHFFVVVVFAGNPKDGNRFHALGAQTSSQLDYGERLVNRIQRPGEQPGLLTSNNCNRPRTSQHIDVLKRQLRRTGSLVDPVEGIGHPLAIELLRSDSAGVICERRIETAVVWIEARNLLVVVHEIVK